MQLFEVRSVAEVLALIEREFAPLEREAERVPLEEAAGRVLAEELAAPENVPGFDRSTVDGYAVRAAETTGASESLPAMLKLAGAVAMGRAAERPLGPGEAVYVPTGAMLPPGADAVAMIEHVEELDDLVNVLRPVAPGENVIRRDEDLRAGEPLLPPGHRLRVQDLAALAAAGRSEVPVRPRLGVAVLSTGDEVRPATSPHLEPGEVRDVNGVTLSAAARADGARVRYAGIVPDDEAELARRAAALLAENDVLLLSGGSSVGTKDMTERVIAGLGRPGVLVHGVALHPGKPALLARIGEKAVVGLPGHPVSALLIYHLFVRPILARLDGERPRPPRPLWRARLARNLASHPGESTYVRIRLVEREGELWAEPVFGKSGLVGTLLEADGFLAIPPEREGFRQGETVEVFPLV
ncbi:MAG: molybdopterin molybdotransferase MoeA [Firmicutes bacterium]|nr:molybdopterin molybdotransferase MoeA [Bacillota bacterium]